MVNAIVHLLVLSVVAFFHFLLEHRMADIQDWVYFHGWEVVSLGKIIALFIISRFVGILSIERRPFISLFHLKRGFLKKDILIALTIFILGIVIVGKPNHVPTAEIDTYRVMMSFVGHLVFYGSDALLILALNEYLPLKRSYWPYQVVLFSLLSYLIQRNVFLFGVRWEGDVIFSLILVFYLLKVRGEFVWLHSFLAITLLFSPLSTFFGLDPLWGSKFSPFQFTGAMGGLEIGVFTLLTLVFLRRKTNGLMPV